MAAAERAAPKNNLLGINLITARACVVYGCTPVLKLVIDIDELARLPAACAKVAIIKHQASVACAAEHLSKRWQAHVLGAGQTMRHHDHGWFFVLFFWQV